MVKLPRAVTLPGVTRALGAHWCRLDACAPAKARATALACRAWRCTRYASLIIATTISAQVSHGTEPDGPMVAVFWQGAMTSARVEYEAKVVEMALEKTRAEYGDYVYAINTDQVTNSRLERDIREGQLVNIVSSPTWHTDEEEEPALKAIPIPIVHGLLGYRQLVVRKDDLDGFRETRSVEDLQPLTAGLGSDWVDVDIFNHNGLQWFGGKSMEQLYSMLARGRLDYLPLSSIEIERSMSESGVADQLAVVPDLVIYYQLPVFVQVSSSQPLLAERVEKGLRKGREDGTLERLFEEHYQHIVNELQSQDARVITLDNPYLPSFVEAQGPDLVKQ